MVTVALCARRSLVCLSQILPALPGTPLTATHRQGHKKDHEHDRYGNNDDNDSRRYGRNGDQQGVAHFVCLQVLPLGRVPRRGGPRNGSRQTGSLRLGHGGCDLLDTFRT